MPRWDALPDRLVCLEAETHMDKQPVNQGFLARIEDSLSGPVVIGSFNGKGV